MTDHLDIVELGERRLGDILQRLAGRIRQQVEVEPVHRVQLCRKPRKKASRISRHAEKGACG